MYNNFTNFTPIELALQQLFESTSEQERFMYREISLNPLQPINSQALQSRYINPFTGKPYDGMLLFGEFASLNVLNNNNRIYTPQNYIQYVEALKNECATPKGVYGEYEHPKGYAVDGKNLSHKILDLWYDEQAQKVFGYVLLLNTPDGLKAQEVIKSGGLLGISARGGGAENPNDDGTFNAELRLLVTYDLVYHPGFSTSLIGHNTKILFENNGKFYEKKLNQNQQKLKEDEKDEIKLQKNQSSDKEQIEKQLQKAVDQQLNENFQYLQKLQNKYIKI